MLIPGGLCGALLVLRDGLVGASLCVQTTIGQAQPLDRPAVDEVLLNDLADILQLHKAVPDRLGIDDNGGAVLALVQAPGLIGTNLVLQPSLLQCVLEGGFELLSAPGATAWARGALVALVGADKDVVLELGQAASLSGLVCDAQAFLRQ
jgi:hypothetical protein